MSWDDPLDEENGNPLKYSCLGNPMDTGAWWAAIHNIQRVGHLEAKQQLLLVHLWILLTPKNIAQLAVVPKKKKKELISKNPKSSFVQL